MAKALVIVESPAKAKTINKYLGKQYVVKASLGHIKDLPKRDLAVDVERGFEPRYEVIEGKKKLISELRQEAKKVDAVYLAADPDREGEAICYHLQEELQDGKKDRPQIFRVMFNEITKGAIQKAFEKPMQVNLHLVDAQQARRVLDRLVGYKISPLLWDKVRRGLSAGRVQTVALRLIVEREREIRAFVPREYWTLDAELNARKPPHVMARLVKIDEQPAEIASQEVSEGVLGQLDSAEYIVRSVTRREKKRNPVAPFITSTLQQESSRKLRFSVKRTMMLAQRLYEGVEIGKDSVGLITYMRTDSTRISEDAIRDVRHYIGERYGQEFLPESPNVYKSKKDAQDAHEAIRPTSMAYTPEVVEKFLAEDEMKLYRLIWNRFVASQMNPALYDQTTIEVAAKGKNGLDYLFRATGSIRKFEGFLKIYEEGKDQADDEDEERRLPTVVEGEVLRLRALHPEQHFTEPPPRYNEATLVKRLEADGVGRPSTYASILSTIQEREYVSKEGGRFIPTELGMVVTDLLLESFDDIFEVKYTARMEEELDEIEEGKIDWRAAMSEFYERFDKDLKHAEEHMTDIKRMEKPTDLTCEKCGKPLVIKWGKHGSFIACTGYPEFSPRSAEADLESLQKEAANRQQRARADFEKRQQKLQARFPGSTIGQDENGKFSVRPGSPDDARRLLTDLKKLHKAVKVRREQDREKIEARLEKIRARYPQMEQYYDLGLVDETDGVALQWKRKDYFCTYTRELTVDLPDVDKVDLSEQGDEEYCENCGRPMVLKKGRFGTFYACTGFPDCKTAKPVGGPQRKPDQPLDEKCPQCGSNLVIKSGRFGEFTACSNYPTCKYVKHKTIGVPCPECSTGEVVERRSKRGKTFYGCNRWPECNFVAWGKPVPEKCPECGSPYMVEKWLKAGPVWQCPNADCKHKQPAPEPVTQ